VINQALAVATPEQRKILDENYGRKDDEAESRVKVVFKELKLDEKYEAYEEAAVAKIRKSIEDVDESKGFKRDVLTSFLNKIYKRSK